MLLLTERKKHLASHTCLTGFLCGGVMKGNTHIKTGELLDTFCDLPPNPKDLVVKKHFSSIYERL